MIKFLILASIIGLCGCSSYCENVQSRIDLVNYLKNIDSGRIEDSTGAKRQWALDNLKKLK